MPPSTFKDYFIEYWLSTKWLSAWIDASRPSNCESNGLWRTNNYTEAQIKRIAHCYLRRKQALSLAEYLKILANDIILDASYFARQLNLSRVIVSERIY